MKPPTTGSSPAPRLYHVVAVYERTGHVVQLSRPAEPMAHAQAATFRSNMMQVSGRRLELREAHQPQPG